MKSENKNKHVAEKIIDILQSGLTINADTQHYIDSTFSNPSIDTLAALLKDEANCETDSLVELLFCMSPVQLQLEEMIDAVCFEKHDERAIQNMVGTQLFQTRICFRDGRGSFEMEVSLQSVPSSSQTPKSVKACLDRSREQSLPNTS